MKLLYPLLAGVALGGCASSHEPPPLPMPSPQAPRIAINRPPPKPNAAILAARAAPSFRVLKSDGTVSAMLKRWGKDAGWSVEWKDAPDIPITGDGQVDKPDFLAAADAVITFARGQGYRLKAKAYADNVLEIRKADE